MATPTSKATFKSYCKRALGFGVIDINVSDDQVDDRVDEALQYFSQYHYDGVERMYLKYQISQDDIDRSVTNTTTTATDKLDSTITASFSEGKNFIPIPDSVLSVLQIFPFSNAQTNSMFDIRYQLRLNDLYDLSATNILYYEMVQQHITMMDNILVGQVPIRYKQHMNRLYLDMDIEALEGNEFLIIECHRKIDPTDFTDIFNDMWLKRYSTALVKYQWGENLSKFEGVALPGGVTLNASEMKAQAQEEITKLEEESRLNYELPVMDLMG